MFDASYIIQLDVLIQNGVASKGAISFMKKLEEENMPYVIITEQSGRIRDHIADYFIDRGFRYIRPSSIYTSSMACTDYIHIRYPKMSKAAYLGGAGIKEALEKGKYQITFDHPDFVLLGMNKKSTYYDYSKIAIAVREGALLVSTDNREIQIVDGLKMIGNASIVKMIEHSTNTNSITFGRGCENLLLMTKLFMQKENILFIGNDFQRDIIPAINCEFTTVFVTEGRSIEQLGMNEKYHPDYIVEDLYGLTK